MRSRPMSRMVERRRPEFAEGFSRTVMIPCQLGLHLRVATVVVIMARRYKSDIYIATVQGRVHAKTVLGVLGLGAVRGTSLALTARGRDADRAIQVLGDLFESPTVLCKDGPAVGATEPATILAGAAAEAYNDQVR